jgi:hypothetical protein
MAVSGAYAALGSGEEGGEDGGQSIEVLRGVSGE